MLQSTEVRSAWKADREAMTRDVLDSINVESRSTEELILIYEAADIGFGAWAPPMIHGAEALVSPWTRESERAFVVMEAIAEKLADATPNRSGERTMSWRCWLTGSISATTTRRLPMQC